MKRPSSCCRIALTGGPGGGKTTASDLFRRELGDQVVVVPEAATLLYLGGFPRTNNPEIMKATQHAIFHVQRNLEDIQAIHYQSRILICDRGTVDGAAFWPSEDPYEFFSDLGTTIEQELARYDAVLFFETAAVGGISIEGGNPVRKESLEEAVALDKRLRELWSRHPNFIHIPHESSFLKKISKGLNALARIVQEHSSCPRATTP